MKRPSRAKKARPVRSGPIFAVASFEEIVRLLRAWRLWVLGGFVGALVGAGVFAAAPPPFRARATVNVDLHLELAWPESTDREQFYYLERETRKLMEIAWSDSTLQAVAQANPGDSVEKLRSGVLALSQPGVGGWHFFAQAEDADRAEALAGEWARAFVDSVRAQVISSATTGLEPYITADASQVRALPVERTSTLGMYILVGTAIALALIAFAVFFLRLG